MRYDNLLPALLLGVLLGLGAVSPRAAGAQGSSAAVDPAPFPVRYRGHVSWLRTNPLFVRPGERVTLEALEPSGAVTAAGGGPVDRGGPRFEAGGRDGSAPYALRLEATGGQWERLAARRWAWTAPPEPGSHRITLAPGASAGEERSSAAPVTFNAFVLVPPSEVRNGELNGYRIGEYPRSAFRGLERYRPPTGFVEVTPENRDLKLSPHFRLGDFLSKQPAGWPRYVVVQERLLWKLEAVIAGLHRRYGVSSLHVMSGYRTPAYNASIGQVKYSRHQYGDAADVFVDESPRDGRMDDLNGDGRSSRADARAVYRLVDRIVRTSLVDRLIGGLGSYPATPSHGPFVHIDARGYRARW